MPVMVSLTNPWAQTESDRNVSNSGIYLTSYKTEESQVEKEEERYKWRKDKEEKLMSS